MKRLTIIIWAAVFLCACSTRQVETRTQEWVVPLREGEMAICMCDCPTCEPAETIAPTDTHTVEATSTRTPTSTPVPTNTETAEPTATSTSRPTATNTPRPTRTPVQTTVPTATIEPTKPPVTGEWIDLIEDRNTYTTPPMSKPGYLETVIEPTFGTRLTRITGDPGTTTIAKETGQVITWGDVTRHHYSKDQPWNADQSLIHITRNNGGSPGSIFLDGETYEVLFARNVPGSEYRWHPILPTVQIYLSGNQIGQFDIRSGQTTTLRTFSEYSRVYMGPWEGNLSADGCRIALYTNDQKTFGYDLCKDVQYPAISVGSVDWSSISPSGQYVVVQRSDSDSRVYDIETMSEVCKFTMNHNHYDMGFNVLGEEVAAGVSKRTAYDGRVILHRISDCSFTALSNGGYASHTSMRSFARPGWAYSSMHPTSSWPPYRDEVVSIATDGSGRIQRWAHMRNVISDYLAESQPVPSPDGMRVIFGSNWNASGGRPVQCYVVDARAQ